MALEADVKMIACQMTMDLFEYKKEDMIDGLELGGAATYMEQALKSDVNLFVLPSISKHIQPEFREQSWPTRRLTPKVSTARCRF